MFCLTFSELKLSFSNTERALENLTQTIYLNIYFSNLIIGDCRYQLATRTIRILYRYSRSTRLPRVKLITSVQVTRNCCLFRKGNVCTRVWKPVASYVGLSNGISGHYILATLGVQVRSISINHSNLGSLKTIYLLDAVIRIPFCRQLITKNLFGENYIAKWSKLFNDFNDVVKMT